MTEDTKARIDKAKEDMESAEILMDARKYNTSCYLSYQSAEKYIKALIGHLGFDIPKTHDLFRLIVLAEISVFVFNAVKENCIVLNRFATEFRYPEYDCDKEGASVCLDLSKEIQTFILSNLSN